MAVPGTATDEAVDLSVAEAHPEGVEGRLQVAVGANLRRVRREMGLSQEQFGETVGWHRTLVGAVERGERNLTLRSVERISDQLGVHPLDLLWDRAGVAITIGREGVTSFMPTGGPQLAIRAAAEGDDDPGTPERPRRTRPRRTT